MTIHGLYREDTRPDLRSLRLDVAFAPDRSRLFHAWCYTRDPLPSRISSACFVVPVRTSRGLRLTVGATLGEEQQAEFPLNLGFGRNRGLRCGTYVVALLHGASRAAGWWQLVWRGDPGASDPEGVLFTGASPGARPVGFPYVLVSVARPETEETVEEEQRT